MGPVMEATPRMIARTPKQGAACEGEERVMSVEAGNQVDEKPPPYTPRREVSKLVERRAKEEDEP